MRVNRGAIPAGTQFFIAVENCYCVFLHGVKSRQPNAAGLHLAHVKRVDAFEAEPGETVLATPLREALEQNGDGALVVERHGQRHLLFVVDVPEAEGVLRVVRHQRQVEVDGLARLADDLPTFDLKRAAELDAATLLVGVRVAVAQPDQHVATWIEAAVALLRVITEQIDDRQHRLTPRHFFQEGEGIVLDLPVICFGHHELLRLWWPGSCSNCRSRRAPSRRRRRTARGHSLRRRN